MDVREYSTAAVLGLMVFLVLYWLLHRPKNFPPGPLGFPVIGILPHIILSKKNLPDLFIDWSKKYGNIFSVKIGAMNIVVLNDYDSIQKVMHHPDAQGRPEAGLEFIAEALGGAKGIVGDSGTSWKQLRQFFLTKFREFGIGKSRFEDVIAEETICLMEEIRELQQKAFNPLVLLSNGVSNVISKVTLGKRFDYGDPTFQKLHTIFQEDLENLGFLAIVSTFPLLAYLPLPQKKIVKRNVTQFVRWFDDVRDKHKKDFDEENIDDLMHAFMQRMKQTTASDSEAFNEKNLVAAIGDIFFAGMDTTATTLQWGLLYFIRNPDVQEKFQKELNDVVGRSRMPSLSDRPSMPYVEAAITEIQRLANIAPLGLAHMVERDIKILGYSIPKGTIVQGNFHALMFDPDQWTQPEEFRPERHLDEDGKFVKPPTILAFGTGGRQCLGEQLARMELFIIMTHLLHRFTFKVPEGNEVPTADPVFKFANKPVPFEICAIPRD